MTGRLYTLAVIAGLLLALVGMPSVARPALAQIDPVAYVDVVFDQTITSIFTGNEVYRINDDNSYFVDCIGTGTVTIDAPGTGSLISYPLDCAQGQRKAVSGGFRVFLNGPGGNTAQIRILRITFSSQCNTLFVGPSDQISLPNENQSTEYLWSVEGVLVVNDAGSDGDLVLPMIVAAAYVSNYAHIIKNPQHLFNGNRRDKVVVCRDSTPTSTPTSMPTSECTQYTSQLVGDTWGGNTHHIVWPEAYNSTNTMPHWGGNYSYADVVWLADLIGYRFRMISGQAAFHYYTAAGTNTTRYPTDDYSVVDENTTHIMVNKYLIGNNDPFTIEICPPAEPTATPTPTGTQTTTPTPTSGAATTGPTVTPRSLCTGGQRLTLTRISQQWTLAPGIYTLTWQWTQPSGTIDLLYQAGGQQQRISRPAGAPYIHLPPIQIQMLVVTSLVMSASDVSTVDVCPALLATRTTTLTRTATSTALIIGSATPAPTGTLTPTATNSPTITPTPQPNAFPTGIPTICEPLPSPPGATIFPLPSLAIIVPTLRTLPTITVTVQVSVTAIVGAVQTMEAQIRTPMAAVGTLTAPYSWSGGQEIAATWTAAMEPGLTWLAVLNPQTPAWSAEGTALWAIWPAIWPVLPIVGISMIVSFMRFFLWILHWLLKFIDLLIKLIELIPGE